MSVGVRGAGGENEGGGRKHHAGGNAEEAGVSERLFEGTEPSPLPHASRRFSIVFRK